MLAVLFPSFISYAQTSLSENELKNYLANNLHNLKPLEGIYFVKNSNNLFFRDEVDNYMRAFLYSTQRNCYEELRYDKQSGRYKYHQQVQYDNSTHIFKYLETNNQVYISNPSYFKIDLSTAYTYDISEYAKIYPTEEMFAKANIERKVEEAGNLIRNGYFSSALAILNDLLKTQENPKGYFLRASAFYGLKNVNAAILDCNRALSYNINPENASAVYYLRGLCHFLIDDKESGISDMNKAGEDGAKFLEENGYTRTSSTTKQDGNNKKSLTTKRKSRTPTLKKKK